MKCFKCKKKGHPVKSCPEKEAECKATEASVHLVWGDANVMTAFNMMNATDEMLEVSHDEVLLDTQANISLFHPSVLQEVHEINKTIRVNGIGGYQMTVSKKGYLPGFFDVYCHEGVKVNVLCFADVEVMFEVSYRPNIGFVVHVDGKEIIFEQRNKLYVAKAEEFPAMLMITVEEKKSQFSGEQVKRAEAAYNLLKNAGYPSSSELINLVSDGNVTNMPALRR